MKQVSVLGMVVSALLFYSGCWLAYHGELKGYGMKGVIGAYLLVVAGLAAASFL